jgi:glucose dehydrogenase
MREISKAMKRARGRRSINLNKRRLKAAWYSRQGWEDPTGRAPLLIPIVRGSFAAGVLSTGGGIVFAATAAGDLVALDSGSGKPLWFFQTGATIASSPISDSVDGKQFVAIVRLQAPRGAPSRWNTSTTHRLRLPKSLPSSSCRCPSVALPRIYRWLQPYAKI